MRRFICNLIYLISPRLLAKYYYWRKTPGKRRWLDFRNPQDLNEKINWLKFYSDTSEWEIYADKYKVRDYVRSKGLERILPALYGVWDNADKIDFDSLPDSFIFKTNHGCDTNIIVKDKTQIDIVKVRKDLNRMLKKKYGKESVELHYKGIRPMIIAEQLLTNTATFSSSIVDYKIWCFNGKPFSVLVCSDRSGHKMCLGDYDLEWNYRPENLVFSSQYLKSNCEIPKPHNFDRMLEFASILSEKLPQARIDFYNIDGNIYFGEMTMTSRGGYMNYYTREYLEEMGQRVDLGLAKPKRK